MNMADTSEASGQRGRVRVEQGAKRVRAYLGGELVADTIRPMLVWEIPYYPTYYFPAADVHTDLLESESAIAHSPSRGNGTTFAVNAGAKRAAGAALRYEDSPIEELRDAIRLEWDAMDGWFEEDEEVFTHPRNPSTRVDILASSRFVVVSVGGFALAESTSPRLLFETGLPVRYYLPQTHVRMRLLELSDTVTHCPYKGTAQAWNVRLGDTVHENLAWCYPSPLPESQKIVGLMAFYNEKVDIDLDGVRQERPEAKPRRTVATGDGTTVVSSSDR
jgi:uncharacterized protein (DUF427 family)